MATKQSFLVERDIGWFQDGEHADGSIQSPPVGTEGVLNRPIYQLYKNSEIMLKAFGNFSSVFTTDVQDDGLLLLSGALYMHNANGAVTFLLPTDKEDPTSLTVPKARLALAAGDTVRIQQVTGNLSLNKITVNGNTKLIAGSPTTDLDTPYSDYKFVFNGTGWDKVQASGSAGSGFGRVRVNLATATPLVAANGDMVWVDNTNNYATPRVNLPVGITNDLVFVGDFSNKANQYPITVGVQSGQKFEGTVDGTDTIGQIAGVRAYQYTGDTNGWRIITDGGIQGFVKGFAQVAGQLTWCGAAGGTVNARTLTPVPTGRNAQVLHAYSLGQRFQFTVPATNTGAVTVNVSGLGVKALTKNGTSALSAGDLDVGRVYEIQYDGTQFQLLTAPNDLGNFRGYVTLSSSRSLLVSDLGCMLWPNGAYTYTLPTPTSLGIEVGSAVTIQSTGNVTTVVPGSGATISWDVSSIANHVIDRAQSATFMATSATSWAIVMSTAEPWKNSGFSSAGFTTQAAADNSTKLATTAFVQSQKASPTFTGVPTAPTAAPATNTQQLATTAFVQAAVASLINSAPGALDTLKELADAMGNDPNFAATVTNQLALKAPLASPALTGVPTAPTAPVNTSTTQLATTAFATRAVTSAPVIPNPLTTDAVTDWNDLQTPGWHDKLMGAAAPNGPGSETSFWYGLVLAYASASSITQVAFPYGSGSNSGAIKYRSRYQGVWTSWAKLYSESSVSATIQTLMAAANASAALTAIGASPLASPTFTGDPKAPTPAQFDNDTTIATTEFVQRVGNSYSKMVTLSTSIALNASHVGALLVGSIGLSGGTVTLPLSSSVPAGSTITISAGAGAFTLAIAGGDSAISIGLSTANSLSIGAYESIILTSTGTSWRAFSGSVPLKYQGSMAEAGWTTAPQFDVSTKLATTEFVQRAVGSVRGSASPANGTTLGPEHVGLIMQPPIDSTYTLPLTSTVLNGSTFHFRLSATAGTNGLTLVTTGGEVITHSGNSALTSVSFSRGTFLKVMRVGTAWVILDSPDNLKYDPLFAYLKGSNGYFKHPSGITIQWANGSISAGAGTTRVTLPLAFDTSLVAYSISTANAATWVTGQSASTTGIDVIARTMSSGAIVVPAAVVGYTFICIGY